MKKQFKILAVLLGLFSSSAFAQEGKEVVDIYDEGDHLFGIKYSIGLPTQEFKEFIDEASFRGINFEYDFFIGQNLSVGFSAGYTLFHQIEDKDTYSIDRGNAGIDVTAKVWKYNHLVPLMATLRYYYAPSFDSWVYLYGGLGLGTTYVNQEAWVGLSEIRDDDWRFSFAPEIGLDITTGGFSTIQLTGQYNYILNGHNDEDPLTHWNIRVGYKKWINR